MRFLKDEKNKHTKIPGKPAPTPDFLDKTDQGETPSIDESAARSSQIIESLPSRQEIPRRNYTKRRAEEERIAKEKEEADKIFNAEQWGPVAALPFDIAFLATKYNGFLLSPEETKRVGYTLAKVVQYYGNIDPKYAILIAFLSDYLTLAGKRVIMWQMDLKSKKSSQTPSAGAM